MTSTRKTIMIAGGLLVAAAGTAYVMLLRADHRAIEDAGIGDSAAPVAAAPAGNDHAVQGAIAPPAPAAATAPKQAAAAPPPAPTASTSAPVAPARVDAAPAPVPVVSDKPQPVTKPAAPPPKVNVVTVNPEDSTPPAPAPAQTATVQPTQSVQPARSAAPAQSTQRAQVTQRAPRKRDGLERHAAAAPPAAMKSETPETAALVRESAKLDPSLPPPSMSSISSMPASTGSYRQGGSSSGANPVAAAMTEQLVRQSSSFKSTAPVPADGGTTATK
ncbi:extensin [Burkholderia cenocepacia]|uniref:extensin n=1 Tax=Burkholderia cenocepacia TaxID=95486 RepID=UPI0009815177|nr:extensin [Burkholderia cenocepacia]AQQ24648.1 extensin [Burkholderia cenocepacia]MCF1369047.1 extensin [Burkholderia cenocepacia]MCF1386922.1 extensin [Burkholderia cenocepacia]MEC4770945.1 extensin [Burkholderia cenocepacia]ONV82487.1 extensin [Burkholderia cenocepacia]